ncbi:MAG: two-component sensor histidine kinase [Anaerolineae bacterium]|nr:HAMP domain-containing protein [Anaerolineales bacterium]MCQ3978112.1 two-component sensor histidine kinase [Anaerolineae bacterium]
MSEGLFSKLKTRLGWKLMASYLIVILVGVVTLVVAVEAAIPTAFNRHLLGMQQMIGSVHGMEEMSSDLFTNFRAAVTESLLVSTTTALVSALIVSLFVSRRVVTPIRQMMEASQRIAAGRYQERVEVAGTDELGQLAHSFNQMAATLEQTEAMRRDLIANVAHELRTPLASIKGYMEGMIDGVLPAESDTYQQIYHEADRLQRLVNDLQELSRVEAGAFELKRRPLAVAELVQQTAARLRPQFEEKGVSLTLNIPPGLPLAHADEDRLNQVLLNLAGNALQYTPSGGTVTVTAQVQNPTDLLISIHDTGVGISAEHLPHLFNRFYRVDKSRSRAGGGSGIGLTIAKHLVEAHGGHIRAESPGDGQGSTFSFSLPLA